MSSYIFTFGTLYEPRIIQALLGEMPPNELGYVSGYAVSKGIETDLPKKIKDDLSKKHRLSDFSFLYAHKTNNQRDKINGKIYKLTKKQESILDAWERYPIWYKKDKTIVTTTGSKLVQSIIYIIDNPGKAIKRYKRVNGDMETYIKNALILRSSYLK